jgi:3-isopropylmalate/(R)-2-methylmalate dehydratase large subunit
VSPLVAAATAIRGTLSSPWDLENDEGGDTPRSGGTDSRIGEKVGA